MNAISRKKKEWEYRNELFLNEMVATTATISIQSVKKAGQLTSFLAYVMYRMLGGVLAIAFMMFVGPKLIRETSPEDAAEEVSLTLQQLESRIKNSAFHR